MKIARLAFAIVFVVAVVVSIVSLSPTFAVDTAREIGEISHMYTRLAFVIIFLLYIVAFAFTIPITTAIAIGAGFLYGLVGGTALVMSATLIGALSIFLYARHVRQDFCKKLLGSQYDKVIQEARAHPISFLLSTRFAPLVPFPLAHLVPAEAGVRIRDFVWTTIAGTFPASVLFIALGSESRKLAFGHTPTIVPILVGLAVLSLVVMLPVLIRRVLLRQNVRRER